MGVESNQRKKNSLDKLTGPGTLLLNMKHLLHVFPAGRVRFDIRITVLGQRFRSIETFESPRRAAFYADCFKTVLKERYALPVVLTLCPPVFVETADSLHVHLGTLDGIFNGLPPSFQDFFFDYNGLLKEYHATQDSVAAELANLKADAKSAAEIKSRAKMAERIEKLKAKGIA